MTPRRTSLSQLEQGIPFEQRHIGPDAAAQEKMLAQVGYGSLDELTAAAVPDAIRSAEALQLPSARTEAEVLAELRLLADRNQVLAPMIGLGYYGTFTPPVILRNVMENPAWYTAYTPYQPEISQGRLEALLNFQTMVAELTGLPTSEPRSSTRAPPPPRPWRSRGASARSGTGSSSSTWTPCRRPSPS